MKYPHLFAPIKINNLLVQNRIIANPMGFKFEDKALGGPGIVIAGSTIVQPGRSSWASPEEPYAFSKYQVEKTRERILIAHQTGAKASIEVGHAGMYARVKDYAMSSCGFTRDDGTVVKAMDRDMMEEVADCFGQTVKDAKDIGFDLVFLHFGHGWLATQFLSPLFNKRTDEYGGSLENRARFPLMILKRIREIAGTDFPVEMRISAVEWMEGGIAFEDTLGFIKMAEPYIDSVQISCGLDLEHEANVHMATTNFSEHMPNAGYAKTVKENVSIPVSVVGAVMNPDEAERLIADGAADMIALGRPLAADPFWPEKAREGRPEDITPCIRCLQCYHISTNRRNVGCSVNPRYANESFVPIKLQKAGKKKKVAVIGAGPAGAKAALTASERGHEVILFEKEDYIGGALHYVAMEHYKEDIKAYVNYLKAQIEKSDIELRLHTQATPEMIKAMEADAVIIAVGASPVTPPIKGIDNSQVMDFYEAIAREDEIGENVVIIGGGTIGAEIGLELAELKNKKVTIVEMTGEIAAQGNMLYRIALRQKMEKADTMHTLLKAKCKEITADKVIVETEDKNEKVLEADTVVIAAGVRANSRLAEEFFGVAPQSFIIGDCYKPRKIMEATFEGYNIAANL